MKLQQAIKKIQQGKIVKSDRNYFLFGYGGHLYYIHGTINSIKMKLAVKSRNMPALVSGNWIDDDWEIYDKVEEEQRIEKIIHNAVKGTKPLSKKDEEFFDEWYKQTFGELK